MSKNILIVHNKYKVHGGEDTVVENEIAMLRHYGHTVVEIIRTNLETENYSFWEKLKMPFKAIFNREIYTHACSVIKQNNIGIVHVHNTHLIISPSIYYAAKKCKVPVITTLHNFRLVCPSALLYRDGHACEKCIRSGLLCGVRHKCYRNSLMQTALIVINNYIHRATGIFNKIYFICLTEFDKRKILEGMKIPENHIYIKSNFTERCIDESSAADADIYLYVGRIEEYKGVGIILKAFEKMPDNKLVCVGTGSGLEKYIKYVNSNNIKNVCFVGEKDKDSIIELFKRAKALVCASQLYETFGMTVIEAFAAKVPVITADFGNVGDLVTDGYNGLKFEKSSVDSLVEAIFRYETMEQKALSDNAYNTYLENYTREKNYEMLMDIYDTIK